MNSAIFGGVFDGAETSVVISVEKFLLCMIASLVLGLLIAMAYKMKNKSTKNFIITLAIMPAMVCVVIMMVNGNVGTGVAVAGAFSLVRFRSVAGSSSEIGAIFLAMGTGLIVGMGYIGFATLFVIMIVLAQLLFSQFRLGDLKNANLDKTLRITIPENLDYTGVFEDLFEKYTKNAELTNVRTTDMGSLFKLTYNIMLKDASVEKEFIDEMRCRNGNLEISLAKQELNAEL